MDHDFVWLFTRFWWLIFPVFWMLAVGLGIWSRHARANRALDILKTYADQGKDPPPELLKTMQGGNGVTGSWGWGGPGGWRYSPERRLNRTFLFGALAIAFAVLFFTQNNDDWPGHHGHHGFGFLIPLLIFTALFLSNLLSLLFASRLLPPSDPNGPRP